jgi:ParB/RepB/Spo0J family partition protein
MNNVKEIPIASITISDRYRKELGNIEELAESIKTVGLLVPILIDPRHNLIAGERRLRAHQHLGKETIQAIIIEAVDLQPKIYEAIENLHRKDFSWQEKVLVTEELHSMLKQQYGVDWSIRSSAAKLGISLGGFSTSLNLADAVRKNPEEFAKCKTQDQAIKTLQKLKIEEDMAELARRRAAKGSGYETVASNHIFQGDCLELLSMLPANSINALITDPPYGVNIGNVKMGQGDKGNPTIYKDDLESYIKMMKVLVPELNRVLKEDAWVCMFCSSPNVYWLTHLFTEHGWNICPTPGIWNRVWGQNSHPSIHFASCYEPFIYGWRGNVSLVRMGQPNVMTYHAPQDKDHPVQKPLELMEELISRFCLPGHSILDPFAGSATTIVAGLKRACFPIGFELSEVYYNMAFSRIVKALELKNAGKSDLIK